MAKRKPKPKPEADEFDLGAYFDPYLICRILGHAWRITAKTPSDLHFVTRIQCASCKSHRTDTLSRLTGELLERRYEYAEDYRHHGRNTRAEYRLELVTRTISDE